MTAHISFIVNSNMVLPTSHVRESWCHLWSSANILC